MHDIFKLIQDNGPAIVGVIAGTGIISIFIQKLKKWLQLQSEHMVYALTAAFTLLGVLLQALINAGPTTFGQLSKHAAFALAVIQPVYLYVIKPGTKLLEDAKAQRQGQTTAAVVATQVVNPTTGITNTTVSGSVPKSTPTGTSTFDA